MKLEAPEILRPRIGTFARVFKTSAALAIVGATVLACGAAPEPSPFEEVIENPRRDEDEIVSAEPPPAQPQAEPPREEPPACEGQTAAYDPVFPRINVLFVLDRSGSMHIPIPNGGTRWTATRDALFSLLDKLKAKNARASVMQFPQGDPSLHTCCGIDARNEVVCSCSFYPAPQKRCTPSTYAVPLPMDLNDKAVSTIKASVNASNASFYWGTPLAAALTAAVDAQKASKNDGIRSVILLTDGAPTSCDTPSDPNANDIERVVAAARRGMTGTEKVRTYVLGIMDGPNGARGDLLSKVAVAGGTARTSNCSANDSCFYPVDVSTFATTITSTLEKIARDAADCTFDVPETPGATMDEIDVTLVRTGGPQILERDPKRREGWDLLEGGKQFKLFGEACKTLKEDPKAKVQIVVGCKDARTK